jgi:hypothetical protein
MTVHEIDTRARAVEARIAELQQLRVRALRGTEAHVARLYRVLLVGALFILLHLNASRSIGFGRFWVPIGIIATGMALEMFLLAVIAWRTYGWSRTTWRDWSERMWTDARTPIGAYVDTQRVRELTRLNREREWLERERPQAFEVEQRHMRVERAVRRYDRQAAETGIPDEIRQKIARAVRAGKVDAVRQYLTDIRTFDALADEAHGLGEAFCLEYRARLQGRSFDADAARVLIAAERRRRSLLADAHELGLTDVTRDDLVAGKEANVLARIAHTREVRGRRDVLERLRERIEQLDLGHREEPRRLLATTFAVIEQPRPYRKAHHNLTESIEHAEALESAARRRRRG